MKLLTCLSLFVLASSVFAQEPILLEAPVVQVRGDSAIVARTSNTGSKVTIQMQVPMARQECISASTVYVMRASEHHCGADYYEESYQTRHCDWEDKTTGKCGGYIYRTEYRTVSVPRTCEVPETVCHEYGTVVRNMSDDMTITFKGLHSLEETEFDFFRVTAKQKSFGSNGVIYEVEALETKKPVKVRRGKRLFGKSDDDFHVERK